jgi:hypothetical protein
VGRGAAVHAVPSAFAHAPGTLLRQSHLRKDDTAIRVHIRSGNDGAVMPLPGRPRRERDPDAVAALERAARACRRKADRLNADLERLRSDRDAAIRDAYRAGIPMGDISDAFALSRQRVSKIIGH